MIKSLPYALIFFSMICSIMDLFTKLIRIAMVIRKRKWSPSIILFLTRGNKPF